MANIAQRSFAGGELSPSLYARTDQNKYATGLRKCRNFIIQKHGGITNRAGTGFIWPCLHQDKRVRLLPFIFNAEQTYVIELGDHYARFIRAGAIILPGTPAAWVTAHDYKIGDTVSGVYYCTVDHTSGSVTEPGVGAEWSSMWYLMFTTNGPAYEVPTPYDEADLPDIQYVQSADVITIVHPKYAPHELKRYADNKWVLAVISFTPTIASPSNLVLGGGSGGTSRSWAVTAISTTGEESLPTFITAINRIPSSGTPTTLVWDTVPGAVRYNVYRSANGQTYGLISPSVGVPSEVSDNAWTDNSESVSTFLPLQWVSASGQCRNALTMTAISKAFDGNYTIKGKTTLTSGFGVLGTTSGRVAVYYSRDGEPRVWAGYVYVPYIYGSIKFSSFDIEWTINVPDNGYSALTIDIVPEIHRTYVSGSVTMKVDFITVGFDKITWGNIIVGTFSDIGDTPDILYQPPYDPKFFRAIGQYPSTVTYYQQRLLFGNTTTEPEKVWASRTGNYKSYTVSFPIQNDDAVVFGLAGRQVNAVRHLLDLGKLIVMTGGAEISVEGDDAGILRPDAINPQQISYNGSGRLQPLPINDSAVYVQARNTIVRDLKPINLDKYSSTDLTIFAAHLFEGYTIADWAFAQTPNSIVWVVRSDGKMLGLTYLREHEIWGWHRHDTDGVVENVCVVPEGAEDRVYLVVRRTIEGVVQRYIERMASRFFTDINDAVFVDSALTYNGWNDRFDNEVFESGVTIELSGGTTWAYDNMLTITHSLALFTTGNVGDAVVIRDTDGEEYTVLITEFVNVATVRGFPNRTIPVSLRSTPTTHWAMAVDTFSGLDHLEGKDVAVFGDGFVVTSPNNPDLPTVTVLGGEVTFDRPYARLCVGLPYLSDMETLDIDTPSGASRKDRGTNINRVGLFIEKSRGIWVGRHEPEGTDPIEGLIEMKPRSFENPLRPVDLITDDIHINIESNWDSNGRIFVRQVDPLPLTILAAIPQGYIG